MVPKLVVNGINDDDGFGLVLMIDDKVIKYGY